MIIEVFSIALIRTNAIGHNKNRAPIQLDALVLYGGEISREIRRENVYHMVWFWWDIAKKLNGKGGSETENAGMSF